jgi:hypothetical protein
MLYIQKSVSENAGNCSHRGRKIQKLSGGEYPQTPPTLNAIPHQTFCYQQTIYHFFTLGIVWSLLVDGPPTDEFLKNALACVAGSLVSQRSEAKKMADFDVCSRHFHDNWSVILKELPLTNRDPELQTTFSPPWFWQCF